MGVVRGAVAFNVLRSGWTVALLECDDDCRVPPLSCTAIVVSHHCRVLCRHSLAVGRGPDFVCRASMFGVDVYRFVNDGAQVKHIDRETRHAYAELLMALAANNRERVLEKYKAIGVRTKHMSDDILWSMAVFWNDHDAPSVTRGK